MNALIDTDSLKLRSAGMYDALLLYKWATDPAVRSNSLNTGAFDFEHHIKWYAAKLQSGQAAFLILESYCPHGMIRFDRSDSGNEYTINFLIDEAFKGRGLGTYIVKHGMLHHGSGLYKAVVKKNNIASASIFRKLNFKEGKEFLLNDSLLIDFEWQQA